VGHLRGVTSLSGLVAIGLAAACGHAQTHVPEPDDERAGATVLGVAVRGHDAPVVDR